MKIVPNASFSEQDIKNSLELASLQLPVVMKIPKLFTVRALKAGSITHLYLCDDMRKKFVGVASVIKDKLPFLEPAVRGVRIFQSGVIKEYRGLGFIWRVINLLGIRNRIFASPSLTIKGKKMWEKRIELDHKNIYLLTNPNGIYSESKNQTLMFVPVHSHNYKQRASIMWDGSLKTQLLMVKKSDMLLRRYDIDIKND